MACVYTSLWSLDTRIEADYLLACSPVYSARLHHRPRMNAMLYSRRHRTAILINSMNTHTAPNSAPSTRPSLVQWAAQLLSA